MHQQSRAVNQNVKNGRLVSDLKSVERPTTKIHALPSRLVASLKPLNYLTQNSNKLISIFLIILGKAN